MSTRPAYNCGADDCCEGSDYPACQLIETSDGRNYTIKTSEAFRYDPDQDYTDHAFTD